MVAFLQQSSLCNNKDVIPVVKRNSRLLIFNIVGNVEHLTQNKAAPSPIPRGSSGSSLSQWVPVCPRSGRPLSCVSEEARVISFPESSSRISEGLLVGSRRLLSQAEGGHLWGSTSHDPSTHEGRVRVGLADPSVKSRV